MQAPALCSTWPSADFDRKLRAAGKAGARVAVIIGENEVAGDSAVVRDLDGHSQQTVAATELADTVTRILRGEA